jgi:hypothetical protein
MSGNRHTNWPRNDADNGSKQKWNRQLNQAENAGNETSQLISFVLQFEFRELRAWRWQTRVVL